MTATLPFARGILRAEARALDAVADRLDDGFEAVVERIDACHGRIAVTGVGKSDLIGRKLVATLNSTGTRAYPVDATAALHGDLGMVHPDDVVLVLSHSGESDELIRLLGPLRQAAAALVAITSNPNGTLARAADAAVVYGPVTECCPLSLAPSTSTTVMLALGDALAFEVMRRRGFTAEDFARFHPAGSLGRKLARVEAYMRTGADLRLAPADDTVRDVFARSARRGRRTGAIMLTDADDRLCGIFTDSDLARLFERRGDAALDRPVREVMTAQPRTIEAGRRMAEALDVMHGQKISELPVIDPDGRPVGLLDITDLLDLLPVEERAEVRSAAGPWRASA